ncbi:hypothetical protein SKAU_G00003690 [Synaphobranchus kaupii]|uniref:Uncharacterized protein n=1 Tax=Synaphobranchus kaupii TaxID=118154 RepID=A0A9Q1G8P7_SYNKA|nr:hypothetical protein SKAU_G00003690 [Synaphobranchus kaupii]
MKATQFSYGSVLFLTPQRRRWGQHHCANLLPVTVGLLAAHGSSLTYLQPFLLMLSIWGDDGPVKTVTKQDMSYGRSGGPVLPTSGVGQRTEEALLWCWSGWPGVLDGRGNGMQLPPWPAMRSHLLRPPCFIEPQKRLRSGNPGTAE